MSIETNCTAQPEAAAVDAYTAARVRDQILSFALGLLSAKQRRAILLKHFTRRRYGMRSSSTPGHVFWYPELVRDEQEAAVVLGLPKPDLCVEVEP